MVEEEKNPKKKKNRPERCRGEVDEKKKREEIEWVAGSCDLLADLDILCRTAATRFISRYVWKDGNRWSQFRTVWFTKWGKVKKRLLLKPTQKGKKRLTPQ
jgi:hypothetical protein